MKQTLFALTIVAGSLSASADVILQESFDYAAHIGAPLASDIDGVGDGGVGFESGWSGNASDGPSIADSGFSYTDSKGNTFLTEGVAVRGTNTGSDPEKLVRDIESGLFKNKTVVWASFGFTGASSGIVNVSFNESIAVGQGTDKVSSNNWQIFDKNASNISSGVVANGDGLFVARLTLDGSSDGAITNLQAWINPDLDTTPTQADAGFVGSRNPDGANLVKLTAFIKGTDTYISEIRIGDFFSDVAPFTGTPVPEPTHFALIGIAIVGAGYVRRSRKHTADT